jgi:NTP pyrophosphatase (non-canonical NTP hydrolase)
MNQLETGEAPEAVRCRSDLQKELAEVLRQRAAISAVLRGRAAFGWADVAYPRGFSDHALDP